MFPFLRTQRRFNVSQIPGVFANLDGSNVNGNYTNPANGTPIGSFVDSINGYNFVQASGAAQPIFTTNLQNGLSGVEFSAASNMVGPNGFLTELSNVCTFYFVIESITGFDVAPILATPDDLSNRFLLLVPFYNGGSNIVIFDFGDIFATGRTSVAELDIAAAPYIHTLTAQHNLLTNYRNGVLKSSNAGGGVFIPGAKVPNIGFTTSVFNFYEMIACNVPHTLSMRNTVLNYLNTKWGIY